jgi:acetylornithine deacetylase
VADSAPLKAAVAKAAGDRVTADCTWEVAPIRLRRLPGFETTVVKFTTDLPYFGAWGEGFLLGPGSIRVAHTDHESVAKADLLEATDLYARLATQLMGED